jgi:3D (Asp-Asp-Asp) domain-containing protein
LLKKRIIMSVLASTLMFSGGQAFATTYQIHRGDTFWKLSQSHKISLQSIERANPRLNPWNLQVGQLIQIPSSTYVAKPNDTLWKIARAHHIDLKALEEMNPHVNPYNVYPGLAIKLPGVSSTNQSSVRPSVVSAERVSPKTVNGQALQFTKKMNMVATAYTASAASNGQWGAVDYFGNSLKVGTVAVDPHVIPLGSKLYVTGYSFDGLPVGGMFCTATDVGGGIKGNHIDIFVPSSDLHANNFGIQNVTVYILKD